MKLKVRFTIQSVALEVTGTFFEYEGIQLCSHVSVGKDSEGFYQEKKSLGYSVSEVSTGLRIWPNFKKKKDAFDLAKKAIDTVGVEKTKAVIKEKLKELV